jgi:hypothetical protein
MIFKNDWLKDFEKKAACSDPENIYKAMFRQGKRKS